MLAINRRGSSWQIRHSGERCGSACFTRRIGIVRHGWAFRCKPRGGSERVSIPVWSRESRRMASQRGFFLPRSRGFFFRLVTRATSGGWRLGPRADGGRRLGALWLVFHVITLGEWGHVHGRGAFRRPLQFTCPETAQLFLWLRSAFGLFGRLFSYDHFHRAGGMWAGPSSRTARTGWKVLPFGDEAPALVPGRQVRVERSRGC